MRKIKCCLYSNKVFGNNQLAFQNHSSIRIQAIQVSDSFLADFKKQHLGLCSKHYEFV